MRQYLKSIELDFAYVFLDLEGLWIFFTEEQFGTVVCNGVVVYVLSPRIKEPIWASMLFSKPAYIIEYCTRKQPAMRNS